MREKEVRVISRLREPANAVVQVMILPAFATARLELHPLRTLNPGPNGGESRFTWDGRFGVAVRGPRGGSCSFTPLLPGEVVRVVGGSGRRMRLEPDDLRLGAGRIGVRNALNVPRLLDVEWLSGDTVIARTSGVNQGSVVSASFDDALWFAAVIQPALGVRPALYNATRFLPPQSASKVLVEWHRFGGQGGRDVFLCEAR